MEEVVKDSVGGGGWCVEGVVDGTGRILCEAGDVYRTRDRMSWEVCDLSWDFYSPTCDFICRDEGRLSGDEGVIGMIHSIYVRK